MTRTTAIHDAGSTAAGSTAVWSRIAEPIPNELVAWRQDGKVVQRDGRYIARFVAYIEANTLRERLDREAAGQWELRLTPLPTVTVDEEGEQFAFRARLTIFGITREDVGTGRDYKAASTDAFKRAGVRFGVAHELYSYGQNWVEMDGDGRYARPLDNPARVYARRLAREAQRRQRREVEAPDEAPAHRQPLARPSVGDDYGQPEAPEEQDRPAASSGAKRYPVKARSKTADEAAPDETLPECPSCGGAMWDNRRTKRSAKAPDFKCKDRDCDGVIWPSKKQGKAASATAAGNDSSTEPDETELPF